MIRYCLDANVFIQSKNDYYPFNVSPAFWEFLEQKFADNTLYSVSAVFEELQDHNDEITTWSKYISKFGSFVEPTDEVYKVFSSISQYVEDNWKEAPREEFLNSADPMLIAQAKVDNSELVTFEIRNINLHLANKPYRSDVKIPDICDVFGVKCTRVFDILKKFKPEFVLKGGIQWKINQQMKNLSQSPSTSTTLWKPSPTRTRLKMKTRKNKVMIQTKRNRRNKP